jgi:hypothetical protein
MPSIGSCKGCSFFLVVHSRINTISMNTIVAFLMGKVGIVNNDVDKMPLKNWKASETLPA